MSLTLCVKKPPIIIDVRIEPVISLKIGPNDTTGLFHQIGAFIFHEKIIAWIFSFWRERTVNMIFFRVQKIGAFGENA